MNYHRLYSLPNDLRSVLESRYDGPIPIEAIENAEARAARQHPKDWEWSDANHRWQRTVESPAP